jgi:hypothetical protein
MITVEDRREEAATWGQGDTFMYQGELYLAIDADVGGALEAVRLTTGEEHLFSVPNNTMVRVDVRMVVS